MHPGAGEYDKTLVNALIHYDSKNLSNIGDELRPGIVHRIDKDTSGLVVIAKNNISHENLSNQFSKHSIKRVYQTLTWGKLRPQFGKIDTLITRSSKNRQLMEVGLTKGKKAITNYKTLHIQDSLQISFMNEKTDLLNQRIDLYMDLTKELRPKWYNKPVIHFFLGAATIVTASWVVSNVK